MSDLADSSYPRHGGDLAHATRAYGQPQEGWLDLSTGINPTPYPAPPVPNDALTRLPDRAALARLIEVARRVYRVPDGVALVAVPGTEIAIRLIPLLAPPGRVAIAGPTYGSHADAWRQAGREAVTDSASAGAEIAVVVNPNNPDGRVTPPTTLVERARRASLLVVDEAFVDATPSASIIPEMGGMRAVVLRSLGKFYGLAGVRLGLVAAAPEFAGRLAALLGDWPVSGAALTIGAAALGDDAWRASTLLSLEAASVALRDVLNGHGLTIVGRTPLFVLAATDDAHALHRALAERGIWTRAFADQPRWLRFGLPGSDGMARLADALTAVR